MASRIIRIGLLISTGLWGAEDPWRFVEPGAKMLAGIHWKAIRESAAGVQFRQDLQNNIPLPQIPGTNFLTKVENILIWSPGPAGAKAEAPLLMVVTGQFDAAAIRAAVNKKSRRAVVQNTEIFESAEGHMGLAVLNPEVLLIGDVPSVVRAIGGARSGAWDSPLTSRGRQMENEHDFWMISAIPPGQVTGANVPLPVPLGLDDVRSMEMGVRVTGGFNLTLGMEMGSAESAKKFKTELAKAVQLASKEKSRPDLEGLDRTLKVTASGDLIRMTVEMTADDLRKRMRTLQARRQKKDTPQAALPAKPANSKPVIWNADPPDKP